MNDRKNLRQAIKLNDEMIKIENEKQHLDEIHKAKIDIVHFGSNGIQHTIFWKDIEELELESDINKIVEIIQNKRRNLLTIKENRFKEL